METKPRPGLQTKPAPYRVWGTGIESAVHQQMQTASQLPVAVRGALMPDAHVGYGLPIGGVLGVRDAVIPYGVGMDIGCRMKLTVLDLPLALLDEDRHRFRAAMERCTAFGVGAHFPTRQEHAVMDENWRVSPVTARNKDKAWEQLGSSGSGNHFVDIGVVTVRTADLGIAPGRYLGVISHSGSRGTGGDVATHYSKLAAALRPDLPKQLTALAWLELASEAGQEYWAAMQLMGRYAAACHEIIHCKLLEELGAVSVAGVENHHNFAWREEHLTPEGGREALIVHRKGAIPAHVGRLAVIPGSMASPGYVVRGLGEEASLRSAAHGAGRKMSRKKAQSQFSQAEMNRMLDARGVELLSAGLDEAPMAYKDIEAVMKSQSDLVEVVAAFEPRLVKMSR